MENETKMVYVVKDCLTKGIEYVEIVTTCSSEYVKENIKWGRDFHKNGWFETKEEAIDKAEEIRTKKLQSLDKQMKKFPN